MLVIIKIGWYLKLVIDQFLHTMESFVCRKPTISGWVLVTAGL